MVCILLSIDMNGNIDISENTFRVMELNIGTELGLYWSLVNVIFRSIT